jgi:hypothetical protein
VTGEPGADGVVQRVAVEAGQQPAERRSVGCGVLKAELGADFLAGVGLGVSPRIPGWVTVCHGMEKVPHDLQ